MAQPQQASTVSFAEYQYCTDTRQKRPSTEARESLVEQTLSEECKLLELFVITVGGRGKRRADLRSVAQQTRVAETVPECPRCQHDGSGGHRALVRGEFCCSA